MFYTFGNLLNTISIRLENVYLSVFMSPKIFGHCISQANARKVTKFYILLHLDKNWCWLDIGGYRPIGGAAMPHFPRIFRYLKYLISLGVLHGTNQTQMKGYFLGKNVFVKFLCTSNTRGRCCWIFSSNLMIFLILYISKSFVYN